MASFISATLTLGITRYNCWLTFDVESYWFLLSISCYFSTFWMAQWENSSQMLNSWREIAGYLHHRVNRNSAQESKSIWIEQPSLNLFLTLPTKRSYKQPFDLQVSVVTMPQTLTDVTVVHLLFHSVWLLLFKRITDCVNKEMCNSN